MAATVLTIALYYEQQSCLVTRPIPSMNAGPLREETLPGGPPISHVINLYETSHTSQNGSQETREMQGTTVTFN